LSDSHKGVLPDIVGAQRRNSRPSKLPKTTTVTPTSFLQKGKVIQFIQKTAPGEWPEHANEIGSIYAEWVIEETADPEYIVLYLHGAAYVLGSAQTSRFMSNKISKFGNCRVFAINYRLAPQNPYPCGLIDAVSAYIHLLDYFDPSKIIIAGESAGGGLGLATLLVLRDMILPPPCGGYFMSPWIDLTHSCPSFDQHEAFDYLPVEINDPRLGERLHYYTDNEHQKLPYVSPLFGELSGLSPLLVQCGGAERLYGENKLLSEKPGICIQFEEYRSHVHVFPIFSFANGSKVAMSRFGGWMRKITAREIGFETNSKRIMFDFNGIEIIE
jgi:acetyl esterase/lipase